MIHDPHKRRQRMHSPQHRTGIRTSAWLSGNATSSMQSP